MKTTRVMADQQQDNQPTFDYHPEHVEDPGISAEPRELTIDHSAPPEKPVEEPAPPPQPPQPELTAAIPEPVAPAEQPVAAESVIVQPEPQQPAENNDFYQPAKPELPPLDDEAEEAPAPTAALEETAEGFSWQATEYAHHHRGAGWFALLFIGAAVLGGLIYFFTKDWFAAVTIVIVAILVAIIAARKPDEISYVVTSRGVQIGNKSYGYNLFRSFTVTIDNIEQSIQLFPKRRFMPPLAMFYQQGDFDKIVNYIGEFLPLDNTRAGAVDRLAKRLRF